MEHQQTKTFKILLNGQAQEKPDAVFMADTYFADEVKEGIVNAGKEFDEQNPNQTVEDNERKLEYIRNYILDNEIPCYDALYNSENLYL